MRKVSFILALFIIFSCNRNSSDKGKQVITVTIAPYSYFIHEIAGDDFRVNVMVPAGANPHIYEPYPGQIDGLRKSEAYISNGFLGFEMAWMPRFREINLTMKKVSVGEKIVPITTVHDHGHEQSNAETADPHYWVSPRCAIKIALAVKELVSELNPDRREYYEKNYEALAQKISVLDKRAESLFSEVRNKKFMIYHPNLAYLARDYGLEEIAVEFEGKEPSPSQMKELIDLALRENINTIFIQKEFDIRNAKTIAGEIGAEIRVIDPLSEDWLTSTGDIITGLYNALAGEEK